jgi:hypothetical protein
MRTDPAKEYGQQRRSQPRLWRHVRCDLLHDQTYSRAASRAEYRAFVQLHAAFAAKHRHSPYYNRADLPDTVSVPSVQHDFGTLPFVEDDIGTEFRMSIATGAEGLMW